jgi:hypothetical protein
MLLGGGRILWRRGAFARGEGAFLREEGASSVGEALLWRGPLHLERGAL